MLTVRYFINVGNKRMLSLTGIRCKKMFDPMDHATGIEKKELQALAAGCKDPFGLRNVIKRCPSTAESPNLIPSAFEGRIVGCVCHEHQRFVCWMWLEKGEPKRCECGHWFKLQQVEPFFSG